MRPNSHSISNILWAYAEVRPLHDNVLPPGSTGGFVWVGGVAGSLDELSRRVEAAFPKWGLALLRLTEEYRLADDRDLDDETRRLVERALREPESFAYGTFTVFEEEPD